MSEQSQRGIFGDPGTAQPIGLGVVAQRPNFTDGTEVAWDKLRGWLADLKAQIEARPIAIGGGQGAWPRGWAGTQSGDASLMLLERQAGGWLILLWKGHSTWVAGLTDGDLERLIQDGPKPEILEALANEQAAKEAQGWLFMPCPFCRKNTARGNEKEIDGQMCCWVSCENCGAIGPAHADPEQALGLWNMAYRPKLTLLGLSASMARKDQGDEQP